MLNRLLDRANALAPRSKFVHAAVIGAILLVAVVYRFGPSAARVFFGDDLATYLGFLDGGFASSLHAMLFGQALDKYRPTSQIVLGAMMMSFGTKYFLYLAVAFVIHVLCGLMFYRIVMTLTRRDVVVSLLITLAFVLSRLGYFQVAHFTGVIESVAVLSFLIAVYGSVLLTDPQIGNRERARGIALVLLGTCLAIFSHERYVAITPWAMLVLAFAPATSTLRIPARAGLALAALVPLVLNVAVKVFVIHVPLAVGTGGTLLQLDIARIASFVKEALFTLAGFNTGPAYLIGRDFEGWSDPLTWVGVIFFVFWSGMLLAAVLRPATTPDRPRSVREVVFLALAGLALIAPAVSTIRMEQRWIYASFGMMLAILAWSFGRVRGRHRVLAAFSVLVIFVSVITMDSMIRRYWYRFYLFGGARVSQALIEAKDQFPKEGRIILILHPDACGWSMNEGAIFRIYGNGPRELGCYISLDEFRKNRKPTDGNEVFVYDGDKHRFITTRIN